MTFYDEQLQKLQQQVARKAHLETVLRDLHNQKKELDIKVADLNRAKQDEQTDVDRIEGALLTKFVRKGPQVIVNISNDAWFRNSACGVQQARNAAFRCIELRRSMVRAANRGVCCAIAPNGAFIHALLKADGTPHLPGYSYAVLPVDKNAGFTLYAMLGDWAVLACLLLVLLTSAPAVIEKFSKKK